MHLLIIGTGYVGLVSGTCFAEMGHHVICLDIDKQKIDSLRNGSIPIYEPGLEEMVIRNTKANRLSFTTSYEEALKQTNVCFIAVATPTGEDGSADLKHVLTAAKSVAENMQHDMLIVNKSTVPSGTYLEIKKVIEEVLQKRNVNFSFDVVSNPEFLKEGNAIQDCMRPDRIIIGTQSTLAAQIMKDIYRPFMLSQERILFMDPASAELTKYAANAMLASRISFMNWIAQLCEQSGADILQVRRGIGSDKRIGLPFLWAGIGYGGSCFPKDIRALKNTALKAGLDAKLIDAIEEINQKQKLWIPHKVEEYFASKGGLKNKTIGLLGLSFKPDTDDMREAPSLIIMEELIHKGARLRVYDPAAMTNARLLYNNPQITWCDNEMDVAKGCHALTLLTEWKQFRFLDFSALLQEMVGNAFFDGRNQYTPVEMAKSGFDYYSVGRTPIFNNQIEDLKWLNDVVEASTSSPF